MQLGDLGTHLDAQLRVEVGQRLVEEEDLRVADDGAAEGDALTLAAGQSLRLAVEQLLDAQDLGRLADQLVDLVLGLLAQLEAERHVVIHGHVRIQRVVLEHHRDVAVLRRDVVDQAVANVELALRDLLKAGDHAQRGGLAAAGRSDQNDELLVGDVQAEVGHGSHIARVDLVDVIELQACHEKIPLHVSSRFCRDCECVGHRPFRPPASLCSHYRCFFSIFQVIKFTKKHRDSPLAFRVYSVFIPAYSIAMIRFIRLRPCIFSYLKFSSVFSIFVHFVYG